MLTWNKLEAWVGVFDILGFRDRVRTADKDFPRALLTNQIAELLDQIDSEAAKRGRLKSMVFSDTLIVFAPSLEASDYGWFLRQCKDLATHSIQLRLPLRGAIAAGTLIAAVEHPIILGSAFVEAYDYCVDQNWIGLLLAPSASRTLRACGLEPLHHHFVHGPIPLRCTASADVLAYRYQDGSANFGSHLLPHLREMQQFAPEGAKGKYESTIAHIETHHRWVRT